MKKVAIHVKKIKHNSPHGKTNGRRNWRPVRKDRK